MKLLKFTDSASKDIYINPLTIVSVRDYDEHEHLVRIGVSGRGESVIVIGDLSVIVDHIERALHGK